MKKYILIIPCVIVFLMCSFAVSAEYDTEYIVKLKSDIQISLQGNGNELEPFIPELGLYTVKNISDSEIFEFVEEDATVELFDTYDYSSVMVQEEYTVTGIKNMWDIGVYGSGVRVGIIDSGCNPHMALRSNLCDGASFVDESEDTNDNIGHGTAVSGIVAAEYGFDKCIGAAHKTEIVPLKFIDCDSSGNTLGGTTKRLASAIVAAVNDFHCDVINMSCGTINSNTLKLAVDYAVSKGAIIVAAVGNNGSGQYNYPAAYDNVIGVGSVSNSKEHSYFSNMNDSVFVMAPGENVNILYGTNAENTNSGTSFSTPCVSGIIADMCEIYPKLTADEAMDIIAKTSEDLGDDGYDETFGYGLIRADRIVEYMLRDCECFVSQIDLCKEDNFNEVRIRLKNSLQYPDCVLAEYEDGVLCHLSMDMQYVSDNIIMLRIEKNEDRQYKYFVWNSVEDMIPLTINQSIY